MPAVFGEFSNSLLSTHPDARFPIKLEIVADDTPLLMIGPDNRGPELGNFHQPV